jgi:D-alanyl-D-alanine carboxypeptidase
VGEVVRVRALMHGMLLASGNDAAVALAHHVAGSEPRFVARMNARARRLGLRCTRFVSASGVNRGYVPSTALGNRSCPRDLARLTVMALREPRIARVARRATARVRFGRQPPLDFNHAWTPIVGSDDFSPPARSYLQRTPLEGAR